MLTSPDIIRNQGRREGQKVYRLNCRCWFHVYGNV